MAPSGDGFAVYRRKLQKRFENLPPPLFTLAAEDLAFGQVLLERSGERLGEGFG